MKNVQELLKAVVKTGLTTFKVKNSKASLPARVAAEKSDKLNKKGAVFLVRDKSHFTQNGVKGYIVTSTETLLEDYKNVTHWTPNVFGTFLYSDDKKYVKGFEERNLTQINTFVVDIDTKVHTLQDILIACIDESIGAPTFVVESTRGYQLYFVLDRPSFISSQKNYQNLTIAKRISENIKRSLACVDADFFCNDFGFFRMPTESNVVYANVEQTYSFGDLMGWSMRQDDDAGRQLFVIHTKKGKQFEAASKQEWFAAILNATDIKGSKGRIGRNNAMFTIALTLMAEGKDEAYTHDLLDEYNSRLQHPLKPGVLNTVVNSAYSGKYKGAQKEYIQQLLEEYASKSMPDGGFDVKLAAPHWHKFKKEREDRERSHLHEWEEDVIKFITNEIQSDLKERPFIWHTQTEWCEALNMPRSTFNKLLNESTKIIRKVEGRGRGARTALTTVALLVRHALETISTLKATYRHDVQALLACVTNTPAKEAAIHYFAELGFLESTKTKESKKENIGGSSG